ncbi:MAG: aminotransferase class V-fold PLP-dependent enzyme [Christensenellaceae bacterium]|nr:aminotransferase class V-fold PLP-dependent enzyme [Christensenellaceae bacterium]
MCGLFNKEFYLDNSATTKFKPPSVTAAVTNALKDSANPGRSGHNAAVRAALAVENARDTVNSLVGNGNVVFTKNATEALNLAIFGSGLSGEAVTSVMEHNSVLRPLNHLSKLGKIAIKYVAPKGYAASFEEVKNAITKNTSAVVLAEQTNLTGGVTDIEKIGEYCLERGIKFIIDGAQSLGHTFAEYDKIKGITALCASGHKGLHAPQGTGFLLWRGGKLAPLIHGGTGTEGIKLLQPETFPEGYESGTLNTPGIAGLAEGIKWTYKNKNEIAAKITEKSLFIAAELSKIEGIKLYSDGKSGVISFNYKDVPSTEIADRLNSNSIFVRSGIHCAPLAHKHLNTLEQGIVRISLDFNSAIPHFDKFSECFNYTV